jgi:phosphate transport system substrate-binding protein
MSRPLSFVTNGPPAGQAKTFIDYVLSTRGQELVRRHGYLRMADLKVRKDAAVAKKQK